MTAFAQRVFCRFRYVCIEIHGSFGVLNMKGVILVQARNLLPTGKVQAQLMTVPQFNLTLWRLLCLQTTPGDAVTLLGIVRQSTRIHMYDYFWPGARPDASSVHKLVNGNEDYFYLFLIKIDAVFM